MVRRWPVLLAAAWLGLTLGCHTFRLPGDGADRADKQAAPARPSKYTVRVSQYVFYSDRELRRDDPVMEDLADLRERVTRELRLPAADTLVQVYLFGDRPRYEHFLRERYPKLPKNRRAFFIAQPHSVGGHEDLLVFTYWSDRLGQDLRHELTHALLHSVLKDVPLWLDEGLAEYFELPPGTQGVNAAHVRSLCEGDFRPNLARLEKLSQVGEMNPPEYQEAWAWAYLMLRGSPEAKEVLLAYLHQLRTNPDPGPLQPRLAAAVPSPDDALDRLLDRLHAGRK
jgi:hypothetical protein